MFAQLEVVSVCWDALDGSTLFELIDSDINRSVAAAARLIMVSLSSFSMLINSTFTYLNIYFSFHFRDFGTLVSDCEWQ